MAGILPVIFVSVSVRPPAAAATPFSLDTVVTEEEPMVPRPAPRSVSMSMVVPAAGRVRVPVWPRNPNAPPPPLPAVGVLVTVMSVPVPYSACSTLAWAFLTPDDTEVTTMTRPIPRARPTATMIAWRIRRRSSRRRYVRNIWAPTYAEPAPSARGLSAVGGAVARRAQARERCAASDSGVRS